MSKIISGFSLEKKILVMGFIPSLIFLLLALYLIFIKPFNAFVALGMILHGLIPTLILVWLINKEMSSKSSSMVSSKYLSEQILKNIPINVMTADKNGIITMANDSTIKTLKAIQEHLPIPVEKIVGSCFDIFHKNPSYQQKLIKDPKNLPHNAVIDLGPEKLDLYVTALYDHKGEYTGPLLTWSVVTEKIKLQEDGIRSKQMIDNMPINVMTANTDGIVTYMNPASYKTLKAVEEHLPIAVDEIIGNTYDVFHKSPARVREILSNPKNLPYTAEIALGPEFLELNVSALFDKNDKYVGPMVSWSVITDKKLSRERELTVRNELESTIESLKASVRSLSENSEGLASSMQGLADNSEEIQSFINSVSVATEEMIASISEISKNTDKAASMTQNAVSDIEGTESVIRILKDKSEEIEGILNVVTEIANQTNLLALNATIEAARAGDAGKGFAVVANEVKELANRTTEATEDINEKISAIQLESQKALDSISTASNAIRSINEVAVTIAGSVEEQTAVTAEIGKSMKGSTEKVSELNHNVQMIGPLVGGNTERTSDINSVVSQIQNLLR